MELIAVLLIMAICLSLGFDLIAQFDAEQRAERSARNCVAFLRYARNLAMTTGYPAKLTINTSTGNFAVYSATNTGGTTWNSSPVSQSLIFNDSMSITLGSRRDLYGTSMTVSPSTITEFDYNQLGTSNNSGTLTFSCAGVAKQVVIPAVGDPVLN
jgi:Tfp pilus assembly protein FimT